MKERRGRARIWVDGEFWAEIDAEVAFQHGLREGTALEQDDLDAIRAVGERALAMNRALHYLGYRARSRREVGDRLRRYGYGEETVHAVLERLEELGYLDDEEFARNAAREKSRRYGPQRVVADLRRSGVAPEMAQEIVEAEFAEKSELEQARLAAERRYNGGGSDAQVRRVYGFLMRRGYSADVCAEVARGYRGAREAD